MLNEKSGLKIPEPLKELKDKPVLHKETCEPAKMIDKVKETLKIEA